MRRKSFFALSVLLILLIITCISYAEEQTVTVSVSGMNVPVEMTIKNLKQRIGVNFGANWDSIRVYDSKDKELPYQIDDLDLNGILSGDDELVFVAPKPGEYKIVVSDDPFASKPEYKGNLFVVEKAENGGYEVATSDKKTVFSVRSNGIVDIKGFDGYNKVIAAELGLARTGGFNKSTWWADKNLGPYNEVVSYAFRVKNMEIFSDGPVRLTIVAQMASEMFPGLEQTLYTKIYPNGEVKIDNVFEFRGYADMAKVQSQMTHPLVEEEDTVHILPVFRRMGWADAKQYTPEEYWKERGAVQTVDGTPYIIFPATDKMKPLFWGATYIFASVEKWRANYSPSAGIGIGEINLDIPEIPSDLQKFVEGRTWVYESSEFRTGQFQWIAGEFNAFPGTADLKTRIEDTVVHYIPGDREVFSFYYIQFRAKNEADAIRFLNTRRADLTGIIFK